ncbi:MAG: hypothetical protein WDZ83_06635 [Rhizobiaceae bacterium]
MDKADKEARARATLAELNRKWSKRLRFVVQGHDDRYSTAWTAWEHEDSLYFTGRHLGGSLKVSLHPGVYRVALEKHTYRQMVARGKAPEDRCIVEWPPKKVEDQRSIDLVASVMFPTDHLKSAKPPATTDKPYIILEAARSGWSTEVSFFLTAVDHQLAEQALMTRSFAPVFRWDLSNGTYFVLAFREREFDVMQFMPGGASAAKKLGMFSNVELHRGQRRERLTAMLWNEPTHERPLLMVEVGGIAVERAAA